jgi:hypothetical protein
VGITFSRISSSYWIDNLGFLLREKLAAIFITHCSWGFPTGRSFITHIQAFLYHHHRAINKFFWSHCRGGRRLLQGEFSHAHPLLCFKFCFTLFLLALFYKKPKKISILDSCFYLSAFSLVRMSNPKVEVRTFKQQGGESLKDAWYRISNSRHRCTKKHSTMILLRNFYVGITSWYRYVLDTLAGGNFLGTPALEACTLIESLVRVPPIHVVKIEVTLEEVLEKLSSLEKSLPKILDIASRTNELIESIGKRITVLEASTTLDSKNLRIGKLEESMKTLSSIFSSLKFKKEKFLVEKSKNLCMFPRCLCLNRSMFLRLVRLLVQLRVTCRLNHLWEPLKCLVW